MLAASSIMCDMENSISPRAMEFIDLLRSISIKEDELVPMRLVSLLWMLAAFLEWQTKSISEKGGDIKAYEDFVNEVETVLEEVLGVP